MIFLQTMKPQCKKKLHTTFQFENYETTMSKSFTQVVKKKKFTHALVKHLSLRTNSPKPVQ